MDLDVRSTYCAVLCYKMPCSCCLTSVEMTLFTGISFRPSVQHEVHSSSIEWLWFKHFKTHTLIILISIARQVDLRHLLNQKEPNQKWVYHLLGTHVLPGNWPIHLHVIYWLEGIPLQLKWNGSGGMNDLVPMKVYFKTDVWLVSHVITQS